MNRAELDRLAEVLPAPDALEGKARKLAYLQKEVGSGAVRYLFHLKLEMRERLEIMEMHQLAAVVHAYADEAYTDEVSRRAWLAQQKRRKEHSA
jgi:hypothetical protein